LLLALLTGPAFAESSPAPAVLDTVKVTGFPMRFQADETTTAMKTETALIDVPQALSVVTEQQIEDQAMVGMADVLRYVPGAGMAQGEGHRDAPVLRGNLSTSDFYSNGIRDDAQYYRDLYNVSQVEILKGPNALIFGRGGTGGIVNRVIKEADGIARTDFLLRAGEYGFYRAQADVGAAADDNLAYRFNALYENAGSFRDGVGTELAGLTPSIAFGLGADSRMVLTAEAYRDRRTVDRGIPSFQGRPLETPRSLFFGDAADSDASTDVGSLEILIEAGFGNALLTNRMRIAEYDKFYQNIFPGRVNADASLVSISAYNNTTERSNWFNQTDLVGEFATGAVSHKLLGGMELGWQETHNFRNTGFFGAPGSTQTVEWVGVSNPKPSLPIRFRQATADADADSQAFNTAVYAQDQMRFGAHWQLIVGLRMDWFDLDYDNNRNGVRTSEDFSALTPRAGLIYNPVDSVSLYAAYSESFLPRAGEQLASLTPANANLDPESFENAELGVKWQINEWLFTSLAVYRLDRGNVAVTDPDDPGRFLLIDAQRNQGLEWEITGNLTENLLLTAGYANQDASYTRDISSTVTAGTVLPLVPEHSGYLWGMWTINPRWAVGLGMNSQSRVYTSTSNAVALPGFTRFDGALFFNQSETLEWQLNIENLSDRHYFSTAHNDNNITIGTPRTVLLSANLRF
jgi:catecholate siderophore receptor